MQNWLQRALLSLALGLFAFTAFAPDEDALLTQQRSRSVRRASRAHLPCVRQDDGHFSFASTLALVAEVLPTLRLLAALEQTGYAEQLMATVIADAEGAPHRGRGPPALTA